MFEDFSKRNKAIVAALELATEGGWSSVTFPAIAERSGVSLADLRRDFTCKTDILRAFQAEIDADVLTKSKVATPEQSPRDRVGFAPGSRPWTWQARRHRPQPERP